MAKLVRQRLHVSQRLVGYVDSIQGRVSDDAAQNPELEARLYYSSGERTRLTIWQVGELKCDKSSSEILHGRAMRFMFVAIHM
jgi:hypothetical protein